MPSLNIELISSLPLMVFLLVGLYTDLTKNRIDNRLIFCILISGLSIQTYTNGLSGFGFGLLGITLGFLFFMPFHLLEGMRAGDLKLMAAIGAFLTVDVVIAAGLSLIAGAGYGVLILLWYRGGAEYFTRYSCMALEYASSGKINYQAPAADAVAATSFPYATAIATGTVLTLMFFR